MSGTSTKVAIEQAGQRFIEVLPALAPLKLVVKLDLQARSDHQIYRVEFPGPQVSKDVAADAKIELTIPHAEFNRLADPKSGLPQWISAFETGVIKVGGETSIQKLLANVIERQQRRHGV